MREIHSNSILTAEENPINRPGRQVVYRSDLDYEKRKENLIRKLRKQTAKVDCVLITSLPNLTYFFNYAGASFERFCGGFLSLNDGKSSLVIPKLDEGKSNSSSVDEVFTWTDSEGYKGALERALKSIGGKSSTFGCEDLVTLNQMEEMKAVRAQAKFRSVTQPISEMRLIKSDEEIAALRGSAQKLGKGYEKIPSILKAGMTEIDVAYEIKRSLSDEGLPSVDFCGVQSGADSAVPHSLTSKKKLSPGDMVVIDIAATDELLYYADFTRTFCVGRASEEQRKVYEIVKEAQSIGVGASIPGRAPKLIDKQVREIIQKSGYGKYFVHRTGHGLGLEVHEPPWINSGNSSKVKPGMVFTVEPGIYLPGKFGVRIEDNVVITSEGNENLTRVTHDLIEV